MHEDVCVSIWREEGEGVQDKNSNKRIAKFDLKPVFSKVRKLISLEAQKFACFTKRSALLQETAPICIFWDTQVRAMSVFVRDCECTILKVRV